MCLSILPNQWAFWKFKALPGHPNPGNAGRGWTHPINYVSDPIIWKKTKGSDEIFPADLRLSDYEIVEKIIKPILLSLRLSFSDVIQEVARADDGTILEIVILRGGSICFEEFPSSEIPIEKIGRIGEHERMRGLRAAEMYATDDYMCRTKNS